MYINSLVKEVIICNASIYAIFNLQYLRAHNYPMVNTNTSLTNHIWRA